MTYTNTSTINADRIALLQTFIRIVEAGSLSAASMQLETTTPTVSRRLQALERELKLQLLQRSTRGMTMTEDGERCYRRAKVLLAEWDDFERDIRGGAVEPRGTLRVVAPHAFGQAKLIDALGSFIEDFPQISVEWLLHDRTPDFIADNVDCAIHAGEVSDASAIAVLLAEVPRIVVAAPSLLEGRHPSHASELGRLPWLGQHPYSRDGTALRHHGDGDSVRIPFRARLVTDNLFALRNAALRGLGVCVAAEWVVRDDILRGNLIHLTPAWEAAPLPLWLVYPRLQHTPARVQRFLDAMRVAVPAALGAAARAKAGADDVSSAR